MRLAGWGNPRRRDAARVSAAGGAGCGAGGADDGGRGPGDHRRPGRSGWRRRGGSDLGSASARAATADAVAWRLCCCLATGSGEGGGRRCVWRRGNRGMDDGLHGTDVGEVGGIFCASPSSVLSAPRAWRCFCGEGGGSRSLGAAAVERWRAGAAGGVPSLPAVLRCYGCVRARTKYKKQPNDIESQAPEVNNSQVMLTARTKDKKQPNDTESQAREMHESSLRLQNEARSKQMKLQEPRSKKESGAGETESQETTTKEARSKKESGAGETESQEVTRKVKSLDMVIASQSKNEPTRRSRSKKIPAPRDGESQSTYNI